MSTHLKIYANVFKGNDDDDDDDNNIPFYAATHQIGIDTTVSTKRKRWNFDTDKMVCVFKCI